MQSSPPKSIFVFASNLAGIHGAGSALHAVQHHGAIRGRGIGPQGQSYAIPTKDQRLKPLPLAHIAQYVEGFRRYSLTLPHYTFQVVKIGCGLAGYTEQQIAPMFRFAPAHVILPPGWRELSLQGSTTYPEFIPCP